MHLVGTEPKTTSVMTEGIGAADAETAIAGTEGARDIGLRQQVIAGRAPD